MTNENPDSPSWLQAEVDRFASWSPDGSKLIYTREKAASDRDTSWQFGTFIHDMNTGRDTCLWPNVEWYGYSWSPDGQKVAVVQWRQVYIYDFLTDSLTQIPCRYEGFSVSWSPCGDKLVFFDRFNNVGMQIYDFNGDSTVSIIGEDQALAGDWMADCSTVVVLDSCRTLEGGLYAYNIYRDSLRLIANKPGYKWHLAVSPDGKTVAFTVDYNLWAVQITVGAPYQLTTEGGGLPDWSPDGQWIVFTKTNWLNGYLWIMRPDGSEKHQITF